MLSIWDVQFALCLHHIANVGCSFAPSFQIIYLDYNWYSSLNVTIPNPIHLFIVNVNSTMCHPKKNITPNRCTASPVVDGWYGIIVVTGWLFLCRRLSFGIIVVTGWLFLCRRLRYGIIVVTGWFFLHQNVTFSKTINISILVTSDQMMLIQWSLHS